MRLSQALMPTSTAAMAEDCSGAWEAAEFLESAGQGTPHGGSCGTCRDDTQPTSKHISKSGSVKAAVCQAKMAMAPSLLSNDLDKLINAGWLAWSKALGQYSVSKQCAGMGASLHWVPSGPALAVKTNGLHWGRRHLQQGAGRLCLRHQVLNTAHQRSQALHLRQCPTPAELPINILKKPNNQL